MTGSLEEARVHVAARRHKPALRTLWRENAAASARGDADALRDIAALADGIARDARGATAQDARFLAGAAGQALAHLGANAPAPEARPPEEFAPAPPALDERVAQLEEQVQAIRGELARLGGTVPEAAPAPKPPAAPPVAAPPAMWPPPPSPRPATPVPPTAAPPPAAPRPATPVPPTAAPPPDAPRPAAPPPPPPREPLIDREALADFIGARGLALAGGVVTLLGIVFFFVLAVNRGWVSAELRTLLGAAVAVSLYGLAFVVRRRYGNMQAALAAAGAAIGGAYAVLVAATVLYGFVPEWAALLAAAGIAAVGVATAVAWGVQLPAILGLAGAMIGPALIEDTVTAPGIAFVLVLAGAAVAVALWQDWLETRIATALLTIPELALLFYDRDPGEEPAVAALAGCFALVFLGAGLGRRAIRPAAGEAEPEWVSTAFIALSVLLSLAIVLAGDSSSPAVVIGVAAGLWLVHFALGVAVQLVWGSERLDRAATALVSASVGLAFIAAHRLFAGEDAEGYVLLVVAGVTLAPLVLLPGRGQRNLASILWAASLAVAAVAVGYLLTGPGLALAWAAQGALLSWIAVRAREPRLQLAALGYILLALVRTLGFDSPPEDLFTAGADAAAAIPAALFLAAGAAVFAAALARQPGLERPGRVWGVDVPSGRTASLAAALLAGASALYAASFGLLALVELAYPDTGVGQGEALQVGHIAITAFWSLTALAVLAAGLARSSRLYWAGVGLFGVTAVKVLAFDAVRFGLEGADDGLGDLATTNRAYAILAFALATLAAGFLFGRFGERVSSLDLDPVRLHPLTLLFVLASVVGSAVALPELLDGSTWGIDRLGAGLVVAGAVYAALAALVFGEGERRDFATLLWGVAAAFAGVGLAYDLLDGQWVVLAWSAFGAGLALLARRTGEERLFAGSLAFLGPALAYSFVELAPPSRFFTESASPAAGAGSLVYAGLGAAVLAVLLPERLRHWVAYVVPAAFGVYAVSLGILGFFQVLAADDPDSVSTAFQRGHTAVSGFWGLIGFVLLVAGLRRRVGALRLGGLVLFGVALAKIFLYDLATLSSMARALSFLLVGFVLLLSAFLYQRLTEEPDDAKTA